MGSMKRLISAEDGSELIETALLLPVFVMILFGTLAFAIVIFGWCNITYASRAAVRYASTHSNASLVPATSATVSAVASTYFIATAAGSTSTTVTYATTNVVGGTVKVTVSAAYPVVMPFLSRTSYALSSTAQRTITR